MPLLRAAAGVRQARRGAALREQHLLRQLVGLVVQQEGLLLQLCVCSTAAGQRAQPW